MWTDWLGYWVLALTAFGSATLLPGGSEAVIVAMLMNGQFDPLTMWLVASAGNVAGSLATWAMARYLLRWRDHRWFLIDATQLERASLWFQRYGVWTLMFSWAPLIGDALCFVAGLFGVHWLVFTLFVTFGKAVRYGVLIGWLA